MLTSWMIERRNCCSFAASGSSSLACLLAVFRSLKVCHGSIDGQQEQLNQERLKLDFALRDLNHIKFETAGSNKSIRIQKKSSSSLTGLLNSVQTLSSAPPSTSDTTSGSSKRLEPIKVEPSDEDCDYIDITISDDDVGRRRDGSSPNKKGISTRKSSQSKNGQSPSKKDRCIPVVTVDWSKLGAATTSSSRPRPSQRQQHPVKTHSSQKH